MLRNHILLTLLVGGALTYIIVEHGPAVWAATQIAGLCLLIVGFGLWSIARFQLGNSFTVTAQARQLVTGGLYSRIRNPIYVFGSFLIAGMILVLGRPIWLLIFVVIVPLQLWRARKESQILEEKFGEEYRSYRAGTWF
jgi:protein-S-isoprenylcysteine O-methyltransferase Ste14